MSDPGRVGTVHRRARANPLASGPLLSRDDVARAVVDLYEPIVPYTSERGAQVGLGSFAAVFEQRVAELEGFARPLYGIVPLTLGGFEFAHWDRIVDGLDAGTDPDSPEYWGPVPGPTDQRMVEQADVPFAFHTYGLMYAAANTLGLGEDRWANAYRERASAFANDLQHWFAPDGAAVPFGRSLTYRFAMSSFWGALAWADVQPYWSMKAFGGLAAPADHPFWTSVEEPLAPLDAPIVIADAGQVIARDQEQAVILNARPAVGLEFPEQAAAKYRKFAYSSVFGFSGDFADTSGGVNTDSMLALVDTDGNRRVRLGVDAAGVDELDGVAVVWSTWHPWPDVRVDTVCWLLDAASHGRIHRIRAGRELTTIESGFAVGLDRPDDLATGALYREVDRAEITTSHGVSAIVDAPVPGTSGRRPIGRTPAVNASLMHPRTAVPALQSGALRRSLRSSSRARRSPSCRSLSSPSCHRRCAPCSTASQRRRSRE